MDGYLNTDNLVDFFTTAPNSIGIRTLVRVGFQTCVYLYKGTKLIDDRCPILSLLDRLPLVIVDSGNLWVTIICRYHRKIICFRNQLIAALVSSFLIDTISAKHLSNL